MVITNAVTYRLDKVLSLNRVTIIILLSLLILGIMHFQNTSISNGLGVYGGLFHITVITQSFVIFIALLGLVILLLTSFTPKRLREKSNDLNMLARHTSKLDWYNLIGYEIRIMEYPLVILFILIGGILLMSSSDIISMFLSLELQSYGLYILATMHRNSELATSAGLTYFLLGGLSSCFILLGSSLLYVNTGVTYFEGIYILYSLSDHISLGSLFNYLVVKQTAGISYEIYPSLTFDLALLILSVGYLFKVSSAPFHFWSPDVYDSLPTKVTTFVTIIAKITIFIFILDLVHYAKGPKSEFTWTDILLISSLLSMIIGTVVGLVQSRIKRLLAYSTISHVGFILLALTINSIESIQAFIFYLMQYSLSNLNMFFIVISFGYLLDYYNFKSTETLSEKEYSPLQFIAQLTGFFFKNPILSLCLAITLFSFAGIPPLLGFFAKQMVLSAALEKGYVFMALIAILTSVIGAVYYLRIIKVVFFDHDDTEIKAEYKIIFQETQVWYQNRETKYLYPGSVLTQQNLFLSTSLSLIISIITLTILFFILKPNVWLTVSETLSLILFAN